MPSNAPSPFNCRYNARIGGPKPILVLLHRRSTTQEAPPETVFQEGDTYGAPSNVVNTSDRVRNARRICVAGELDRPTRRSHTMRAQIRPGYCAGRAGELEPQLAPTPPRQARRSAG